MAVYFLIYLEKILDIYKSCNEWGYSIDVEKK